MIWGLSASSLKLLNTRSRHPTPPAPHPFTPPSPPTHLLSESYRLSATAASRSRSCFSGRPGWEASCPWRTETPLPFWKSRLCLRDVFASGRSACSWGAWGWVPPRSCGSRWSPAARLAGCSRSCTGPAAIPRAEEKQEHGVYKPTSLSMIWIMAFTNQPAYHWRELPQVSFWSRQKFCRDKHVFCRDKARLFCLDKSMLSATKPLSRQKCLSNTCVCVCVCVATSFVATSILLPRENMSFVATNTFLSLQNFCRDRNDTCSSSHQWDLPATLFFWYFHSLSSLCAQALAWSEVFFLRCTVCLE